MPDPKLTPKYANRLLPEPAQTNQTERQWRTMQSRGYWESPQRVARYYNVIRTAPPGWKAPAWLDVDAVNNAYTYMRERNGNKPWQEWDWLPETDAGSSYLRSLSAPPDNMLWPSERNDIRNRNRWPEELRQLLPDKNRNLTEAQYALLKSGGILTPEQVQAQQPFGSWEDLEPWQQLALGALSPQAGLQDRPWWTRATAALGQGALAGLGGAAAGGLIGPWGAVAGFLTVGGLSAYQAYTGNEVPVINEYLMLFNQAALALEKGIGVGEQIGTEGWQKIIADLPNAWQAGALTYESGGVGNAILNTIARIAGDEAAGEGQVWRIEQGLSEPQQAQQALGPEALTRYRQMLAEGATMDELYADAQQTYGFSGTVGDFVTSSLLDPLNLAPYAGGKLGAGVAKAAGNERLAAAFNQGVGNPLIDMLPPVVQQLASRATGIRGSTGPLASFDMYRNWVRQGTFPAGMTRTLPEDLSAYEKRIAGLTAEGKIAEIQPRQQPQPGKKSIATWMNYLTTLTDDSRAHVFLNVLHDNVNAMMTLAEGDPAKMVGILNKVAGRAEFAAGDPAADLMASPAIATIQSGLRAAMDTGMAEESLATWVAGAERRTILTKIAQALGEEPAKILEQLQNKPDVLMARLNAVAPTLGKVDYLKQVLSVFIGDDALPWSANQFQAELSVHLFDAMDKWIAETYGLKPDHAVFRLSQVMKSVQSLLLLSFNPAYFMNNELNNMTTRAADGMWGYMTPGQINKWMDRFGVSPARINVGIGAAETGAAFEGGLRAIGKARQANDAIAKAHQFTTAVGNKVGLFSNLSSWMEGQESRQVTTIAMKRFWGKYWRKGTGLSTMPPQLEALLDSKYPGMKDMIYTAAEAGMNMEEINKALFSGIVQPSVRAVIDQVSRSISPDHPDRITDLMTSLGLDDELSRRLRLAATTDDVDAAFNWMEGDMQRRVNEMMARVVIGKAEDVKNKVTAERTPAVLSIFGDMEIDEARHWIDLRHETDQQFAKKGQLPYDIWEDAYEALETRQETDWNNHNQVRLQTYAGLVQALGITDPRGASYVDAVGKFQALWREFYGIRKQKFNELRGSRKKAATETWAQYSNRRSLSFDGFRKDMNDLYDEYTRKEIDIQNEMDDLFLGMFKDFTGWDTKAAKKWRADVADIRAELVKMQKTHRAATADMTAADRDRAYVEFNKRYNAKIAEMKIAEQQGAFEVMKQPRPAAPAIPIPEPAPRQQPVVDIRDNLTPEQQQQYDDLLAKGVPPETIRVDEQGQVSAPAPEPIPGSAVMDMARRYGIVDKNGQAVEKFALNVINKNSQGVKYDNLSAVPAEVADAAFKAHQAKHASAAVKTQARRMIDAQEIVDMADAGAREADLRAKGMMTRRAIRDSLLQALDGDELATEATLMLMDNHADVWARGRGWAAGDNTRDAWYATHIARILNGDEAEANAQVPTEPIGPTPPHVLEQIDAVINLPTHLRRGNINPAFARFYQGSKILDPDGYPIVLYHGTPNGNFTEIDLAYDSGHNLMGPGFYLTDDPAKAGEYANKSEGGAPAIIPGYLSLRNPLEMRTEQGVGGFASKAYDLLKERGEGYGLWGAAYDHAITGLNAILYGAVSANRQNLMAAFYDDGQRIGELARDMGYDGIIHNGFQYGEGQERNVYIAFYPEQFKSVFNAGTWSGRNMLMQGEGTWYYSQLQRVIETKMPNKASKEQVRGLLAGQVKADELKWTGLDEWLDEQKGSVTKQQVMDFLQENQVEVNEVVLPESALPGGERPVQVEGGWVVRGLLRSPDQVFPTAQAAIEGYYAANPGTQRWNDQATKYQGYALPGGGNYRELLMTLPKKLTSDQTKTPAQLAKELYGKDSFYDLTPEQQQDVYARNTVDTASQYTSPHWSEPNVLAHTRFDDRVDADGKRVLFVEEIQSDWHQAGREQGYKDAELRWQLYNKHGELLFGNKDKSVVEKFANEHGLTDIRQESVRLGGVPAAPFSKNWEELSIKRIIRWAAENGYERVAFPTGPQAARIEGHQLITDIETVKWKPDSRVIEYKKSGAAKFTTANMDDGKTLKDYIGFDAAKQLEESPVVDGIKTLETKDIVFGGEKMRWFYDDKLINIANKYIKKWGAKVGETELVADGGGGKLVVYSSTGFDATVYREMPDGTRQAVATFPTRAEAKAYINQGIRVQSFDVTQAMRESAMQGQPLFQKAKGSFELLDDGRAVIRAFGASDISTMVHEIGHVFRRDLGLADMDVVAKLGGLKDAAEFRDLEDRFIGGTLKQGDADYGRYVQAEEGFARGWELYLAEGRAPTPQLKSVFRRFTNWMLGIYKNLKRYLGRTTGAETQPELAGVNLNAQVNGVSLRDIFDRLLTDASTRPQDFGAVVEQRALELKTEGRNHRFSQAELRNRAERELAQQVLAGIKSLDEARALADQVDAGEGEITLDNGVVVDSATIWDAVAAVERRPEIAPWAEVAQIRGTKTTARGIANPNNEYEFQFKVVDLSDLQASDKWDGERIVPNPIYPQELQPRIRSEQQSRAQVDTIARTLVPDELLFDRRTLDRGAPIVGPDNFVESGNGRTLALARAASTYPQQYAAYRQELIAKLPEFGIDPASIEGMAQPVLVRERLTVANRTDFTNDANKPVAMKMNPMEVALNDARLISDQSLVNLEVGDNETIESAVQSARNAGFVQNWLQKLSQNERGELSANGQVNAMGVQRLINALFAKVYTGAAAERLVSAFTMSMDSGVRNAQSAIMASLPQMARMEGMIAAGLRNADLSLAGDVAAAVDKMASIRSGGNMTVTDYLNQTSFLGEELTPTQRQLLEFFAGQRQPKRIREMLREYALQVIDHEPDPNQMGLFGDVTRRTKEDLLNDGIGKLEPEAAEGGLFAAQPEPETTPTPAPEPAAAVPTDELAGPQPGGSEVRGGEGAGTQPAVKEPWQMTAIEFAQTANQRVETHPVVSLIDWATKQGADPKMFPTAFEKADAIGGALFASSTMTGAERGKLRAKTKKIDYLREWQTRYDDAVKAGEIEQITENVPLTENRADVAYRRVLHKRAIRQALSEGKPVPPEVLADYPDLAAKSQPAPAAVAQQSLTTEALTDFEQGRPVELDALQKAGLPEVEKAGQPQITFQVSRRPGADAEKLAREAVDDGRRVVMIVKVVTTDPINASYQQAYIQRFQQGYSRTLTLTPDEFAATKLRGDYLTINASGQSITPTGETLWLYADAKAAREQAQALIDAGESVGGIDFAPDFIQARGTQVVRTQPFAYGGQTVIGKVYRDGRAVAYLPANLDALPFDTGGGQARLLGLDLNDARLWVIETDGVVSNFDPANPTLRGPNPQLFQDGDPMGDVALGGTPSLQEQGRAMDEINKEVLRPAMRQLRDEYKTRLGQQAFKMDDLDDASQKAMRGYLSQVKADMAGAKLATMNYGTQMRDAALLNYSRRYGADNIAQMLFPYELWYTRSFMGWGKRVIDRPSLFAMYARFRQAQERMERDGMPQRMRGKIRLSMPWMPEWMGGGLWVDPLRQVFPPASFFQPMEQFSNNQTRVDATAQAILKEMQGNGEITQAELQEALDNRAGSVWDQALKQAEVEENQDSSAAGLVTTMMSPALWWSVPSALLKGKPETISTLPITRTAQSIETALEGTPLDVIGKAVGLVAKPEEMIRKAAGLSEFGQWGEYYVERMLANMAAEGEVTAEQAQVAMIEKGQNPAYQQAYGRVQQEMMMRTPGALALNRLLSGDLKGAGESLPQLFFSGGLFPEGELKLRGLKPEYNNAWAKYKHGDAEAINNFFDEHPEYEARLALYDEPETRLKQFLISEVWDRYMKLGKADRGKAVKELGTDFTNSFLEQDTSSYDALGIDTLARWSWILNGAVPKTTETENLVQPPAMQPYPDVVSQAVADFNTARDQLYPDVVSLQSIYYELPENQRRQYLAQVPRLKKYWEWKRKYQDQHPEIMPYVEDMKNTLDDDEIAQMNAPLLRQLIAYYLGGESLSGGAKSDLRRIWEASGQPTGDFENWMETVVRVTFENQ